MSSRSFGTRTTVAWVDLAAAVERTTDEVRAAVAGLKIHLASAGLDVRTTCGYVVITAPGAGREVKRLATLERRRRAREGMNFTQAQLLWKIGFDSPQQRLYGVETRTRKAVFVGSGPADSAAP